MGILYGNSLTAFVMITLVLAGGAAWMTGRAIGRTWGPMWLAVAYMIPLAAAARFLHYALASGELLSLQYYVVNLVILMGIAALSHRVARTSQMAQQYPWLYKQTSPVSLEPR
jgi:hypothetical protein